MRPRWHLLKLLQEKQNWEFFKMVFYKKTDRFSSSVSPYIF